jgi:3-hydroxymyristoyl/3-hydroxydecanoyl-(acyl carrier protein) dehydratase
MNTVLELAIPESHGAFAGHFPGNPIVPGVMLLDESAHAIATICGLPCTRCTIVSAKFLSAARPGEQLRLEIDAADTPQIRFTIRATGRLVATGVLRLAAEASVSDGG